MESEYEIFRQKRHEKWNTPEEEIEWALKEAGGSGILKKDRIIEGETNEVHMVTDSKQREFVVRISHRENHKFERFEREKWALEKCAEKGVPVPKPLFVGKREVEGKLLQFLVESKLTGVDLRTYLKQGGNKEAVMKEVGTQLAKIHSVSMDGFGSLNEEGHAEYKTANDLIRGDKHCQAQKVLENDKVGILDKHVIEDAGDVLISELEKVSGVEPVLLHGDIQPSHILVHNGQVSGFIDFENAKAGDRAEEFARWEMKFGEKYPIELFKKGYGEEFFGADFEFRKNYWRVFQSMARLTYLLREGKQFSIGEAEERLKETLRYFEDV
ncbi:MAG: aminoglycoside phosphotransferase family protein [bacterium]|nr:aminoglycoside phosphotransferase family protein [bacterium]